MLLIIWTPWAPRAHELDVVRPNGNELKVWTLIPGPYALEWAEGINLPASAVVTPAEFAIRKTDAPSNYKVRFYGFWLVGLVCWYMVGRFVDDLLRWGGSGLVPRKHRGDLALALLSVPSAVLLAGVFICDGTGSLVLAVWGMIWVAVTGSVLAFRLFQLIRQRRTLSVS